MRDKPLFEDVDRQEATYAPEQLPEGTRAEHRAEVDEGDTRDRAAEEVGLLAVPIAAASGVGVGGAIAGTTAGVAPAVGAAALSEVTRDNDDPNSRDSSVDEQRS